MVLSEMVTEETGGIGYLQEMEPLCVELVQGGSPPVNPIKHAKSYLSHDCLLFFPAESLTPLS
jgi:hypothetical protein